MCLFLRKTFLLEKKELSLARLFNFHFEALLVQFSDS